MEVIDAIIYRIKYTELGMIKLDKNSKCSMTLPRQINVYLFITQSIVFFHNTGKENIKENGTELQTTSLHMINNVIFILPFLHF